MNSSQEGSFRSGFVSLAGRPNAGKSALLNYICGNKLAAVSDKPQTTRTQVRGVLNRPNAQIVFVDTPGIHKPVSALGRSLNKAALTAIYDVDVNCLLIDAKAPFGKGDTYVAEKMEPEKSIIILNKIDLAKRHEVERQLLALGELDFSAYFPVSALTGEGVDVLLSHLSERIPLGTPYYDTNPEAGSNSDFSYESASTLSPEAFWIAEMVREQIYHHMYDDMPYSVATQVVEYEWPYVRCNILVERKSQKGIVIGKGGKILKEVSKKVRENMPKGVELDLRVRIDKNWQNKIQEVHKFGYGTPDTL